MVRRLHGIVLALLTIAGCKEPKGVDIDPRVLIPKDANLVVGFEVQPLSQSALGSPLQLALTTDADMGPLVTAVGKCDLDVSGMRGLLAATTADERILAVVEAPGIGTRDMVRCLENEVGKVSGEDPGLILFKTRGEVQLVPQEDGGHLIILNKNTVAIVDGPWEDEVFAAIDEESERNTDSVLAKTAATIDKDTDLWLAYQPLPSDREGMAEIPGLESASSIAVLCDLSEGLQVDLQVDFPDGAKAKTFAEGVGPLLDELKPELGGIGLPATMLDGVKPQTTDAKVSTKFVMSSDALSGAMTALGPLLAE